MGSDGGKEYGSFMPYVPEDGDRARLAADIRTHLQEKLGGRDAVTRYLDGGERANIPLPRGEALLEISRLEYVGTFRGLTRLRVWLTMRCTPPPGRRFVWNDDYREMIELYFDDRPAMVDIAETPIWRHRYAEMDEETPMRPARNDDPNRESQGKAIRAVSIALLLGVAAIIGEQHVGLVSRAKSTIDSAVQQFHSAYGAWRDGQWAQPPPQRHDNGPGPRMIRSDGRSPERTSDWSRPGGSDDAGQEFAPQRFVPDGFQQLSQETLDQ